MPRRFRVEELPEAGGEMLLSEDVSHHAKVLRLRSGDRIQLHDAMGRAAEATLLEAEGARYRCTVQAPRAMPLPTPLELILAPPKGARLDDCIRAAVEVGATGIHLLLSERTALDAERLARRLSRLRRIASEAARQSEQIRVAEVHEGRALNELLARIPSSAVRICLDARASDPLGMLPNEEAWVAVGPEGGFSMAELEAFEENGFRTIGLPTGVLRVETAVPIALALVRAAQERSAPSQT